jgi:hypothetical protein
MSTNRIADDRGLIGKIAVVWLLVIALLGVAAIDTVSIVRARLKLADTVADAAHEGATSYAGNGNASEACAAAAQFAAQADRRFRVPRRGCRVNPVTGEVTLSLRTRASTILVGRFGPTAKFARLVEEATIAPPSL